MPGLVSGYVCVPVLSLPELVGLEHPLSEPLAGWGAWEGASGFPHPGVSKGVARREITAGVRDSV